MVDTHGSNDGYLAIRAETTKGVVAGVPNIVIPIYSESLTTDTALNEDNPIFGNVFGRFQNLLGMRAHGGEFQALGEPNTAAHLFNILMTKLSTTGSGPYVHTFGFSPTTKPKSCTLDVAKGEVVHRFAGVEASEITDEDDDNKKVFNITVAALRSFIVAEIASVVGAAVTLRTNYDDAPTDLLYAGDLLTILKADGTKVNVVADSITDGDTVTLTTSPSGVSAGDLLYIRPASAPSASILQPFLKAETEWKFGADITAALAATHTPQREGSFTISYEFEDAEGAQMTGSFNPAVLVRTQGMAEMEVKSYFGTPEQYNAYLLNKAKALAIRHFSSTGYYMNILVPKFNSKEFANDLSTGDPIYEEKTILPVYDPAEGYALKVEIANALATI